MNSLKLKLEHAIDNVQLPKEEEICLILKGSGSFVTFIGGVGNVPFEIVYGDARIYNAIGSNDLSIAGKIALGHVSEGNVLIVHSVESKIRFLPSLENGLTIRSICANGCSSTGSTQFYIDDLVNLPYNISDGVGRYSNMTFTSKYPDDVDVKDIYNADDNFLYNIYNQTGSFPLKGTFTAKERDFLYANEVSPKIQASFPLKGVLNLDLGLLPDNLIYLSIDDIAGRTTGVANITFNENYGGNNWFQNLQIGFQLNIFTGLTPAVMDKLLIECARSIGNSPSWVNLVGVRTMASNAAMETLHTRWGWIDEGWRIRI